MMSVGRIDKDGEYQRSRAPVCRPCVSAYATIEMDLASWCRLNKSVGLVYAHVVKRMEAEASKPENERRPV